MVVAVDGPLVVDDVQLLIRAAIDGVGLTFLKEGQAAPYLASGRWFASSETGASRSPATFCTIRAAVSSPRRCPRSSTRFAWRAIAVSDPRALGDVSQFLGAEMTAWWQVVGATQDRRSNVREGRFEIS